MTQFDDILLAPWVIQGSNSICLEVIRGEIDDAIAAHDKFRARVGAGDEDPEHLRRVESLHAKLAPLDAVAADLPRLVSRLRTLQSLHTQSALQSRRMREAELAQDALATLGEANRDALAQLERSAAENMRRIEENVRLLDARAGAAPS